ncbi:MAG: helix-turn-helix domain-containing protein [Niallia sp.]
MHRSYYAVIPANVRYDKDLIGHAKLLYGEITALCNEKGYCWASNAYFAELYNVSKKTISTWINQLVDKKYITSEIKYKEGSKEIEGRYLRICYEPMEENVNTPIEEKVKDNNTSFNNTINNTNNIYMHSEKKNANSKPKKINLSEYVSMTQEEYEKLIEQFGEVNANERIETLNLYKGSTGKKYKNDYLTILNWARKEKKGANNGTNIRRNENAHAEASKISETNERRKKLANIKSNTDIDISF